MQTLTDLVKTLAAATNLTPTQFVVCALAAALVCILGVIAGIARSAPMPEGADRGSR